MILWNGRKFSKLVTTALMLVALGFTQPVLAETSTPWQDSVKAERQGYDAEKRGYYKKAAQAFVEAFDHLLLDKKQTPELRSARAEFLLRRLVYLFDQIDQSKAGLKFFVEAATNPKLDYFARSRAAIYAAQNARSQGKLDVEAELSKKLGFCESYYVIGAFDSERGQGFNTAYGPEKELDLEKSYKGKSRPVSWRPMPVAGLELGRVDLAALFRPKEQCLAYALTFVHSDSDQPVAFRLGSDEAAKIFVDGVEVLADDHRRPLYYDQSNVAVQLSKGWHAVLVKVCNRKSGWGFRLRANAPNGQPLSSIKFATTQEIPGLVNEFKAAKAVKKVACADGAYDTYPKHIEELRKAKKNAELGDALMRYGYLIYARDAEDAGERKARKIFAEALKIDEKNANYQFYYSFTAATKGDFSVNTEENARRDALMKTLELDKEHAEAAYWLAEYYLESMRQPLRAREYIELAKSVNDQYYDALKLEIQIDRQQRLSAIAAIREKALKENFDSLASMRMKASEFASNSQTAKALETYMAILKRAPGSYVKYSVANIYEKTQKPEMAMKIYQDLLKYSPFDTQILSEMADLHLSQGNKVKALDCYKQALDIAPEDLDMLKTAGRLAARLKLKQESRNYFEAALKVQPNDPDSKRYIKYLKKEKRNAFEKDWILPVDDVIAAARKQEVDSQLTHRVLLKNIVHFVNKSGLPSRFKQEVFKIENERGRKQFRGVGEGYYIGDQRVVIQKVRLHRKDGTVVEIPGRESYDWFGRGEFGGYNSVGVSLPNPEIGDIVETESRMDTLRLGFFGDYYQANESFQGEVPIQNLQLVFILPKEREFYFKLHGDVQKPEKKQQGENHVSVFKAKDIPKLDPEPFMPWAKEVYPRVTVSSFKDWNAFAKWYWALVKDQHESNDEIKALVANLTKSAKSDEDKIKAVYDYVVSEIRYNAAWEFGVHGFKPYNATSIFARKFGDCKDKSTLINTMLREVGIESYPVLIFGAQWPGDLRGVEDIQLPLVSHFNHCISYVMPEDKRAGRFLDGTAQYHPYGLLPSMDYGANVVVVTPNGALVKSIDMHSPDANSVSESTTIVVSDKGQGTIKTEIKANGSFGVVLRDQLQNEGRRLEVIERVLARRLSGAKVQKVDAPNINELTDPANVKVDISLEKVLEDTPEGASIKLPGSWLYEMMSPNLKSVSGKSERKFDLILPNPRKLNESVEIKLPANYDLQSVPKAVEIKSEFGNYKRVFETTKSGLKLKRVMSFPKTRIDKEAYPKFRKFINKIIQSESERVILKKSDKAPE